MDSDATSRINLAAIAFLKRTAAGHLILLGDYLQELEAARTLNPQEIVAVADAIVQAFEKGRMP